MQQTLIVVQRVLATLFVAGLACLAITGLLPPEPYSGEIHRWGAHGMIVFAWLALPLAIGLRYVCGLGSWKFIATLAFLFLVLLLSSFTGYLGPTTASEHGQQLGEETHNRFIVLHMCVLPAVLFLLGGIWFWLTWRREFSLPAQP
jgi:quinol-cytochrome oxidoreductase complex cytochrome b subunit